MWTLAKCLIKMFDFCSAICYVMGCSSAAVMIRANTNLPCPTAFRAQCGYIAGFARHWSSVRSLRPSVARQTAAYPSGSAFEKSLDPRFQRILFLSKKIKVTIGGDTRISNQPVLMALKLISWGL